MAKTAYDLFLELRKNDDDLEYIQDELREVRAAREKLYRELKAAFLAAGDRPIYFKGWLYRAAWLRAELVEVLRTEVATPFGLVIPDPEPEPEGPATVLHAALGELERLGVLAAPDPEGETVADLDGAEPDLTFTVAVPERIERPAGEDPAFRHEPQAG